MEGLFACPSKTLLEIVDRKGGLLYTLSTYDITKKKQAKKGGISQHLLFVCRSKSGFFLGNQRCEFFVNIILSCGINDE